MKSGVVAIVGRPNVGKSTIFNRIVGSRVSITEDTPGVTRDRIYARAEWTGNVFSLIDTGGIELSNEPYQEEIRMQVQIAIDEANVILFVCNGNFGITDDDIYIASLLQKQKKPVVLCVNFIDDLTKKMNIYEFYNLGIGEPIATSGIHGIGIGDVLDACVNELPEKKVDDKDEGIRIAVIGEPNVGKSSLVNALLNEDRSIVSNVQGTTRDSIDTPFKVNGKPYVIVDTAGIRKRGKIYESIEKYSVLRALSAIDKSDVVLLVIDGEKGIREQDKHVGGFAQDAGKPCIIVVNKWDTVEKDDKTMNEYIKKVRNEFAYLSYAPIMFVSALTKQRVNTLIPEIDRVYENSKRRIPTNILNEVIMDTQMVNPSPTRNGKRFKVLYGTQVAIEPPTFVMSCNDPTLLHFSYERFLENTFRNSFDFEGTPIKFIFRKKINE